MRLALFLIAGVAFATDPTSNWTTASVILQPPTSAWEAASSCGMRAQLFDHNNVLWMGGCEGIWSAANSCIATDPTTARTRGCYTARSTGVTVTIPEANCHQYMSPRKFIEYNGAIYAPFDDPCSNHYSDVGKWNGTTWSFVTGRPAGWANLSGGGGDGIDSMALDQTNGNIYVGGSGGIVYLSTDDGASFTSVASYTGWGYSGGAIYSLELQGSFLYLGGESPLIKAQLSNLSSQCNILSGLTGSAHLKRDYNCNILSGAFSGSLNMRWSNGDGDQNGTNPTSEILAAYPSSDDTNGSYLQRYSFITSDWSSPAMPNYASPCIVGPTNGYYFQIIKGYTAHEYYIPTGQAGGCNAIIGTVDGGVTWSIVGGSKVACANAGCKVAKVAVSLIDDSKIYANDGAAAFAPTFYYHASPGPLAATPSSVLGGRLSVSGKTVIQ